MNSCLAADYFSTPDYFGTGTASQLTRFPFKEREPSPVVSPRTLPTGASIRVVTEDSSEWVQTVVSQVTRLLSLGPGWDSYGALPIDVELTAQAITLISELPQHYRTPAIFPTSKGGVQLEWQSVKGELEVTFEPQEISYLFESAYHPNQNSEGIVSNVDVVPTIENLLTKRLD